MRTSEDTNELITALVAAQFKMKPAEQTGENPHFRSKYATLQDVAKAAVPALNREGIAVIQFTDDTEAGVGVITRLAHTSGQYMESVTIIPVQNKTAHAVGSAITYARRYGLQTMVGLAAETDDDASAAQAQREQSAANAAEIASALGERIDADDGPGALEIWLELEERQQEHLYRNTRYLNHKQKTKLREWEHGYHKARRDAKEAQGAETDKDGQE